MFRWRLKSQRHFQKLDFATQIFSFSFFSKLTYLNVMLRNSFLASYPSSQFTEPSSFFSSLSLSLSWTLLSVQLVQSRLSVCEYLQTLTWQLHCAIPKTPADCWPWSPSGCENTHTGNKSPFFGVRDVVELLWKQFPRKGRHDEAAVSWPHVKNVTGEGMTPASTSQEHILRGHEHASLYDDGIGTHVSLCNVLQMYAASVLLLKPAGL